MKIRKENEQLRKDNIDGKIKKLVEINSLEEDKNRTYWFDKNKFKKFLAIIDSNKFNYRNKIGKFKYIDIRDLVNNIRNNTISEISAKKGLNTLNEIKNAEIIKYKKRTPGHKELLNLFNDLLDIILTDKTLESESQEDENENKNENDKTLMSSNNDDETKNENENKKWQWQKINVIKRRKWNQDEDEDGDETMSQNEKNETITAKNDILDKIINKSKWFEEQIKSLKKLEDLKGFWPDNDFGDKELKSKYFKKELADMSNDIDKK